MERSVSTKLRMPKLYFPNLNGLRFLAALGVIIHHVEQFKAEQRLPSAWGSNTIAMLGKAGVILFFVLSGFLITYVLLEEKARTGTVAVRHFYARRILRTWPLYFVVILLAFFLWPAVFPAAITGSSAQAVLDSWPGLLCFFFLMPNVARTFHDPVAFAGQTWSIGVEEQFYFVWPLLVRAVRRVAVVMLLIAVAYPLVFWLFFDWLSTQDRAVIPHFFPWSKFLVDFRIDTIALGGLAAWLLHTNHALLRWLRSPAAYAGALAVSAAFVLRQEKAPMLYPSIFAVCFAILLLNIVQDRRAALFLESPVPHYLGRISYGLYMWHPVAIVLGFYLSGTRVASAWVHYPLVLALSIAIAAISYHWFESVFIRWKQRFTKHRTADEVTGPVTSSPAHTSAGSAAPTSPSTVPS